MLGYLGRDEAAGVNGQVFHIAGGDIACCWKGVEQNASHKEEGLWTVEELIELVPKVVLKSESDASA